MTVLSKSSLKHLANTQGLLGSNYDSNNFEASSYDLRVGTIYKNDKIWSLDNPQPDCYFVTVKPSEIITILTLEEVKIPNNCTGVVFPLNSHSSKGLLILNPGHIDPGFNGPLSICAINLSKIPIRLSLTDKIFTLIITLTDATLSSSDLYENKIYSSRKELEEKEFKDRFSYLSTSFFDLIVGYEQTNKLLWDRVYKSFIKRLGQISGILVVIASILGGIYLIAPNSIIFTRVDDTTKKDSIIKVQNKRILKLEQQIQLKGNTKSEK